MTDYTIAPPNGSAWSTQSLNAAKDGRAHDLSFLAEGASGAGNVFKQVRPGIFPGPPMAGSSNIPGAFAVTPTGGMTFSVQPGAGAVERSTLAYPYDIQSTAIGSCATTNGDPSQTRVDRVDLQMLDGALGDNGGVTKPNVKVTAGTPGSGIAAPPINSTQVGFWTIPAGTTTLTAGMWTDTRKSTAVRGGVRVLMPGDVLTDPGFNVAERRMRFHSTYGWLEDFWDAANAVWRGTQVLVLPQSAQVASGTLANAATVTISSTAIADPGWPFYVRGYGLVDFGAPVQSTVLQVGLQIDSAVFGTNRFAFDQEPAVAANASFDLGSAVEGNCRTALGAQTGGSHTVYLVAKNAQGPGGAATITIYTNFYAFNLELIPALV